MGLIVQEIIEAKSKAGELAILNLGINNWCFLWDSQPASNEDAKVLGYWKLNNYESDLLIETDLVYSDSWADEKPMTEC